ncbi:MAG: hypothetical protein KTR35_06400 [Gammaproteobacteria bacterium]|nr:hypothetical protein [Gammaproteobacteria bacterium]
MAHSILEYGDNHLMMRDAELLAALNRIQEEIQSQPEEKLQFLKTFLQSDMVHITGGIDPDFGTHLNSDESREAFVSVIHRIRNNDNVDEKVLENLNKLETLLS